MRDLAVPLQQSMEFERTCNMLGIRVRRFTNDAGSCLVQSRKMPLIGAINLVSRGPVLRSDAGGRELLSDVRSNVRGPLFVNAPDHGDRSYGLRLVGGAELALIDLDAPELMRQRLNQKWRNQLKKAEKSPLRVLNQPLDGARHQWFLRAEQAQQKARRYQSYPTHFLLAYASANKGQARLYTAMLDNKPVAGMLVLHHGHMATYQAGWIDEPGREHCAHNLLLWTIMTDLQRKKTHMLDLGRADLSSGLRRFKMGAGARIERLAGTYWVHGWGRKLAPNAARDVQAVRTTA